MNTPLLTACLLGIALSVLPLRAQQVFQITERGADYRVWERTIVEVLPDGTAASRRSSYVECATGLHYPDANGTWAESKEEIELFQNGAVARHGPWQVIFAPNLNTAGSIDVLSPDAKRFRSRVTGLAYFDTASGRSALFAQTKDAVGQLITRNQILYPDAMAGVLADVRYTVRHHSFEQDIILRQDPPPPENYGLPANTTRIEAWTEFFDPPAGTKTAFISLSQELDPLIRQTMAVHADSALDCRHDTGFNKQRTARRGAWRMRIQC